ncbi:MAG: hypothetical protein ACI9XO_003232 [Paraglaciecola sp.]|jgi:hypothetical protein
MKTITSTLFILCLSFSAIATVYYVAPNGKGKALSWAEASGDLNAVLFAASRGDEIWVAEGTYFPTEFTDRTISFVIGSGIKVYGGFRGNETAENQRDWKNNITILSGAIGKAIVEDNSHTVVYMKNANKETVLNGFVIESGCANSESMPRTAPKCGGGLFNDGSGERGNSTPAITNCTFRYNYGRNGGAVYNDGTGGNASPFFTNCIFENNRTDLDGGAVFNDGRRNGKSNPVFDFCAFNNNEGNYGGAMLNYGGAGESIPTLNACTFENNESYIDGAIFYNVTTEGTAYPQINDLMREINKP